MQSVCFHAAHGVPSRGKILGCALLNSTVLNAYCLTTAFLALLKIAPAASSIGQRCHLLN